MSESNGNRGIGLGWTLFIALLTFVGGNVSAFLTFGLNTVSKSEFHESSVAVNQRLDQQDGHLSAIDAKLSNISGQLTAKKLLAPQ